MTEHEKTVAQLTIAMQALAEIKNWDGEKDYEWGGVKNRASMALSKIQELEIN